jgi:hypothetical protein
MLTPQAEGLWLQYLDAEQVRVGQTMMPILNRFIDVLLEENAVESHRWALRLASQVADEGKDFPIRLPLFRRVLLPSLVQGIREGRPGCARWLAHFDILLHHSLEQAQAAGLDERLTTRVGLLREALRVTPGDVNSRRMLVELHAYALEYTLHELPDCVLSLHGNAATAADCGDLLSLLAELRANAELIEDTNAYLELIDDCDFHYRSYKEYLDTQRVAGSYESYLESRRH